MLDDLPQSTPATPVSYVATFKNSRDPNAGLQLSYDPIEEDVIYISSKDVLDVGSTWGYALIGYFPTPHPGKEGLDRILKSWKTNVRVIPNTHRWITFVFSSTAERDRVLCGGPYVVYGRTLLLKVLSPWFKFGADELTTLPF